MEKFYYFSAYLWLGTDILVFRSFSSHPDVSVLEEWCCSKSYENEKSEAFNILPKWHIPNQDELSFANELLDLHFQSALNELLIICQTKMHIDAGKQIILQSI